MTTLLIALAVSSGPLAATHDDPEPASTDLSTDTSEVGVWSAALELYLYLLEDGDFLMPIARADRGGLHLEGRFQYEDRHTGSVWVGWTLTTGTTLQLEIVPMLGAVVGRTNGVAPGLEATLSWRSLELYTEAEYVFDLDNDEGNFFYDWSALTWQAWPRLSLGLSAQRTRLYRSDVEVDRGVFAAATIGSVELSAYAFNLGEESPFAIIAVAVDF